MFLLKKVFQLRDSQSGEEEKPFLEHLEDLRIMLTRVVLTLLIATIGCFALQDDVMDVLRRPVERVALAQVAETLPRDLDSGSQADPALWLDAKGKASGAANLTESQRQIFLENLDGTKRERVYVQVIWLAEAAAKLPEGKRMAFIDQVQGFEPTIKEQTKELLKADPELKFGAVKDIRFMSTFHPTETFMLSIKIAFFSGLVVSFPFVLFFLLQFVLPGMKEQERKALFPALAIGFGLFLAGVCFSYFFVLPKVLTFFFAYGEKLGIVNDWRIGYYVSFATQFTLLFGLSFELPVVVMTLVKLGILNFPMMSKSRSYAIVAILIIAAILTPTPDIATLLFMAGPMIFLYEICIWLAYFQHRKDLKREAQEEAEYQAYLERRAARKKALAEEGIDDDEDPDDDDPHGPGSGGGNVSSGPRSPAVGPVSMDPDSGQEFASDEFDQGDGGEDLETIDGEGENDDPFDPDGGEGWMRYPDEEDNLDPEDFQLDEAEEKRIRREIEEMGYDPDEAPPREDEGKKD